MNKHIRHAVIHFIFSLIWFWFFYETYGEVGILNRVLRGFLAIAFFVSGIMEIRTYKKSQNLNKQEDEQ